MKINSNVVRELRTLKSWSQEELALAAGLNLWTVQRIGSQRMKAVRSGRDSMNPDIQAKFDGYPKDARRQLESMRKLILKIAGENELGNVEETLKWGEASYVVKGGTAIRIDWKPKDPDTIKVLFHCQTRLIETFREIYGSEFEYEGNRAIVIPLDTNVKQVPLSHCIELAMKYHSVKHLPLLGA